MKKKKYEDELPPMCLICDHYREGIYCDAYPDGIPAEILRSEVDHRIPYAGDRRIQFEKMAKYNDEIYERFFKYKEKYRNWSAVILPKRDRVAVHNHREKEGR